VAAFDREPTSPYWARRLLEVAHDPQAVARLGPRHVEAFLCWASFDPWFFARTRSLTMHLPAFEWPKDLLVEIDRRLSLPDASLARLVKGRLWHSAKLRRQDDPEFDSHAAGHFLAVDERLRDHTYYEELCESLAAGSYERLKRFAGTMLDTVPSFSLPRALIVVMRGAARASDWPFYDAHRARYRGLQEEAKTRGHDDCGVLNLDGLRALAVGGLDAIPGIFDDLLDRGRNVDFLGTPETLVLVRELLARGLYLERCRDYLAMIQRQGPSPHVVKLLSEIDVRMHDAP
jgi:hypothetical protein